MDVIIIDALRGTAIQLGVVIGICLVAWAIFGRRRSGPLAWVGLTGAPFLLVALCAVAGAVGALALLQVPGLRELASGPGTVVHAIAGGRADVAALVALSIVALVKTAFTEELLFRGLLAKRLYRPLGFWGGNLVQAALFGAIHLPILLLPEGRGLIGAAMIGFAVVVSLAAGWVNEKRARGSILPGFGLHAGANLTTYLMLALAAG